MLFWQRIMTLNRMMAPAKRGTLVALAAAAAVLALAEPAHAQYWGGDRFYGGGGGYGGYRSYRQSPQRDFFFPFSGVMRPPPVVDSTKAPAPRKLETPPTTTVVVVGDSLADWLGYGLNERVALRDKNPPPPTAKRAGEPAQSANQAAAAQPPQDKTAPVDSEAAPQAATQGDTQRPASGGGSYEFHTDPWATVYAKRVDDMFAALKSKGVPIVWVGLPAIRGSKSTGDMSYLDELYRERTEKAGIVYVDIWD